MFVWLAIDRKLLGKTYGISGSSCMHLIFLYLFFRIRYSSATTKTKTAKNAVCSLSIDKCAIFELSTMKSRCWIRSLLSVERWKIVLKNIQAHKVHQKYYAAKVKNQYIISFLGFRASSVNTSWENQEEKKNIMMIFFLASFSIFHRSLSRNVLATISPNATFSFVYVYEFS